MDGGPASADVLLQVTDALQAAGNLSRPGQPAPEGDSLEVYVDGGVRRGQHAVKALALGARAVFVGRPAFWGLIVGGQKGVEGVMRGFQDEVERAMALCGVRSVDEIDASLLASSETA